MSRTITLVPKPPKLERKKRVAAYARVSNGKDAMLHSLSAQVSHYSNFIQNHSEWEYVGVYADEAQTGTKDSRENFQLLLSECRAGNIEILLPIWIQSHDCLGSEPPFEYPLNPLFSNRYKHRKRSETLTLISCLERFSFSAYALISVPQGSMNRRSSLV